MTPPPSDPAVGGPKTEQAVATTAQRNISLLSALVAAEDESEVEEILDSDAYVKALSWWPFGGDDSNFATISNQQTDPVAALAEKPVNSIDSVLMQECKVRDIDPEGADAPKTMADAVEAFFSIKDGDISSIPAPEARKLAERIRIIAQGDKTKPNVVVVDTGEGQNPDDFKDTLLSLHKKNKTRIPFVQGKYGMGGTGAIPFAGRLKYQLILSRKDPRLLKSGQKDRWGFTLVRQVPACKLTAQDKHVWFECLVDPEGRVLSFEATRLRVLPEGEHLNYGCYIKLFNYDLESPSNVTLDLWRDLNRRLYSPALPLLMQETREKHFSITKGKNDTKVLVGNRFRVKKDDRDFVRDSLSVHADLGSFGERNIDVTVFKDFADDGSDLRKRSEWTTPQEAVFMTLNGQTHNTLARYWLKDNAQLDSLVDYLLVHVDCTGVPRGIADDVFFGSRDRVRNNDYYREFLDKLASALRTNEVLQRLNEEYRQRLLAKIVPDKSIAKKLVADLVSKNRELMKYFGEGEEIPLDGLGEHPPLDEEFVGSYIPTYLITMKETAEGKVVKEMRSNAPHANLLFKTDAQDDYLRREKEAGQLLFTVSDARLGFPVWYIHDGVLFLRITVDDPKPGERFQAGMDMTRPGMDSLSAEFELEVVEPREIRHRQPRLPTNEGIKLPELAVVRREAGPGVDSTWKDHGWGSENVAKVEGSEVVYVNMDSNDLRSFFASCPKKLQGLAETVYKVGVYLNSVILDMEMAGIDGASRQKAFDVAIATVSKTLLPVYLDPKVQSLSEA